MVRLQRKRAVETGDGDGNADLLSFNPVKYALERCEEICSRETA